jgi:acetyl esterase/lipase
MKEGNPYLIVQRRETKALPPLLILQGADDVVLTPDMNDRFADAWRAAGGQAELEKYAGQPHTFITKNAGSEASNAALKRLTEFVLRQA